MNRRELLKVAAASVAPAGILVESFGKSVDVPITIWKNNRGSRLIIDNKDYGAWYGDDSWWVDCEESMVRVGVLSLDKPLQLYSNDESGLHVKILGSFSIEEIKNEKGHHFRITRALSGSIMKVQNGDWEIIQDIWFLKFGGDYPHLDLLFPRKENKS